jgi:formylglycine-generating enzyme
MVSRTGTNAGWTRRNSSRVARVLPLMMAASLFSGCVRLVGPMDNPFAVQIEPLSGPLATSLVVEFDHDLSWTSAGPGAIYHLQVSASAEFDGEDMIDVPDIEATTVGLPVRVGSGRYWRVRFSPPDSDEWSAWYGPWSIAASLLRPERAVDTTLRPVDHVSPTIGVLRFVPSGSFQRDLFAANQSTISVAFWIAQTEVTRGQFRLIMGADPGDDTLSPGANGPVHNVSWYDAIAFCNKLSMSEGLTPVYGVTVGGTPVDWSNLSYHEIPTGNNAEWNAATADWGADGYRLPTEMEWKWVAMGAAPTGYQRAFAGSGEGGSASEYAWYRFNSSGVTRQVGTRHPNELTVYDMSGNLREWVWDWNEEYPPGVRTDYRGPGTGVRRSVRGGDFLQPPEFITVAWRGREAPETETPSLGFRVVRSGGPQP